MARLRPDVTRDAKRPYPDLLAQLNEEIDLMTTVNSKSTRRAFLTAAAPAALAVATGAVVATGVSAGQPTTAAPAKSKSPFRVDAVCQNNGRCRCRNCRSRLMANSALQAAGILALERLDTALWRLINEDDEGCSCWVCLDCRVLRDSLCCYYVPSLQGTLLIPEGKYAQHDAAFAAAGEPDLTHPADEGLILALHDALDAMLDMTHEHCEHFDCEPCQDIDKVVRPIRNAITLFANNIVTVITPAIANRELLTTTRKLERIAANPLDSGGWMIQSLAEHQNADLERAQFRVAVANRDTDPATYKAMMLRRYPALKNGNA